MEARAITSCLVALKGLQPTARHRVFAYVGHRYGMNIPWPAIEAGAAASNEPQLLATGATR